MSIEIKISKKRIPYKKAMLYLNKRVEEVKKGKNRELLWILEHPITYTAGVRFNKKEILDKKINDIFYSEKYINKIKNYVNSDIKKSNFPIEFRVYPTGSEGMKCHKDTLLYEEPQYEMVYTIVSPPDRTNCNTCEIEAEIVVTRVFVFENRYCNN